MKHHTTPFTGGIFMDLATMSLITGGAALLGALIGSLTAIVLQIFQQRSENFRHARKLAYEAAMLEWRESLATTLDGNNRQGVAESAVIDVVPVPDFYILTHLALIERIVSVGGAEKFTLADYERFFRDREFTVEQMLELREKINNERAASRKN
jgi:hypothetical protein